MKHLTLLTLLSLFVFSLAVLFTSCKDTTKASQQETTKTETVDAVNTPPTSTQNSAAVEAGQNAAGVWHYTCGQGCAGGSGTATNCETCGSLLAHNAAFHAATPTPATPPASGAPIMTPPPANASAGQNASGVWHYTCSQGCAGGSGATGACASCGSALAHNAAFHQ